MLLSRMSGSKMRSTAFSPNAVGMVLTRSSTSFFIQRNGWPLVPVSATAPSTVIEAFEALAVSLRRCSVPLRSFTRIVSPTESGAKGLLPALLSTIVAEPPVVLTFPAPFPLLALDAAVLGAALLREVRAGEQLDARDDGLVDDLRDHVDVVQHPVDPQPHQGEVALGLEVDVGGALLEGVGQDVVEGLDHRRGRGVEVGRRPSRGTPGCRGRPWRSGSRRAASPRAGGWT